MVRAEPTVGDKSSRPSSVLANRSKRIGPLAAIIFDKISLRKEPGWVLERKRTFASHGQRGLPGIVRRSGAFLTARREIY